MRYCIKYHQRLGVCRKCNFGDDGFGGCFRQSGCFRFGLLEPDNALAAQLGGAEAVHVVMLGGQDLLPDRIGGIDRPFQEPIGQGVQCLGTQGADLGLEVVPREFFGANTFDVAPVGVKTYFKTRWEVAITLFQCIIQ